MKERIPVLVARGDGIGPEIMDATLKILSAAGANLDIDEIEIGEKQYLKGSASGISPDSWKKLRDAKYFLKAPITTPRGGGYKSLNVSIRKAFGLYSNVRPCISYRPFIKTKHPDMDVVIIRENEEDTYSGIEHRQTDDVYQCLKLITRSGSEKIIRYAFEYAIEYNRKKVSVFVKDNIMKLTDGIFHKVFNEIAAEYPDIETDNWIVDIGAARLADTPERFDVIVMPNLYGDILSDVAAQIAGSIGLAGSANIGEKLAMFEAIHGSAPDIAGKNIANPSGLILASIMMLVHVHEVETAARIHNAWLKTIEDGVHTGDIYVEGVSSAKVGTTGFANAVIERLGQKPEMLKEAKYYAPKELKGYHKKPHKAEKSLKGVDLFLDWDEGTAEELGNKLKEVSHNDIQLKVITNRGIKVYPDGLPDTFCTDHWRCRFIRKDESDISGSDIPVLMEKVLGAGFEIIKSENLYYFDGEQGFSSVHG